MVRIGGIELYNVNISVMQNTPTLIGMSVVSRFKIAQDNGQMILTQR